MKTGSLEGAECSYTAWGISVGLLRKWKFGRLLTWQDTFKRFFVADFWKQWINMGVHNSVKHKPALVTKGNTTVCVHVDRVQVIWSLFRPFLSRKRYLNHSNAKNTFRAFHLIYNYFYQLLQLVILSEWSLLEKKKQKLVSGFWI